METQISHAPAEISDHVRLYGYRPLDNCLVHCAHSGHCFHVDTCSDYLLDTSPHSLTSHYDHVVRRFGHVAAQLLGVPRVRLYQDSIFTKRSGDGPTLWHSDLNMAPFDTNDFVRSHTRLLYILEII